MTLISLDLETTGTDPDRHEAWEVGLVTEDGVERLYEFPVCELAVADPTALEINGYYGRRNLNDGSTMAYAHGPYPDGSGRTDQNPIRRQSVPKTYCIEIAGITVGAHLMGCAVSFDMTFLRKLLLQYGVAPAWHHRGLDLGSYVGGATGKETPLSSRDMREHCPNEETHTALGDARWNWKIFRQVSRANELSSIRSS